jgi:hypothetical protein
MQKTNGSQILLPRIGVLDFSLLVRQLKHKGFICNIFNCLNEENKRFTNSLSLFFFLSSLAFSLYFNVRQLKCMSFIWNAFN